MYQVSTIWTFNNVKKKHTLYCGEDCMRKFCTSLREHATNVINLKKGNITNNKTRTKITKSLSIDSARFMASL